MDITWPLYKFTQHPKGLVDVHETVTGKQLFPFGFRVLELSRKQSSRRGLDPLDFQHFVEQPPNVTCVRLERIFKTLKGAATHQSGQALAARAIRRDGV